MIVSTAIQMAMAPDAPTVPNAEAGSLDVPTAEAGGQIGVLFGTELIKAPNVVWYGDPSVSEIIAKADGGGK